MLITPDYLKQQQQLHVERDDYGVASVSFASIVTRIIDQTHSRTVLDYGAGKGRLAQAITPKLAVEVTMYDPAIPELADPAEGQFDLVCCIDVLEHIEPECLENVLDALQGHTGFYTFLSVHTGPAKKTLPDGRNAHLIQERPEWWLRKFLDRWDAMTYQRTGNGFYFVGMSRGDHNLQ